MKPLFLSLILLSVVALLCSSCVKGHPAHETILAEVSESLQEEFGEEMSNVSKINIFEHTLKIYMTPEWPNDTLQPFTHKATTLFGNSMRKHQIRNVSYFVEVFQNKEIEGKVQKNRQIAEGRFENSTDRVYVNLFGLAKDQTLFNL